MAITTPFATIEEAIEEIREGRFVVVVDDPDRENEGDLVIAAQFATPETINFMATHGRGLICLCLTEERADQLGLRADDATATRRRSAPPSRSRSRRARASRRGSRPPTAATRSRSRSRPTRSPADLVSAGPHARRCARKPGRRARADRADRGRRRPRPARRAQPGRRRLRDHERRRDDGARPRPGPVLRAARAAR